MKNKKQQHKQKAPVVKQKLEITKSKKRIFWIITFSLPVLFVLLIEAGLRLFNYGGNLDLFIQGPEGFENYLTCNPNVGRRYFYLESGIPTPPLQLFLKNKPSDSYRIFVLGESSAAGFPYSNNASFPNILSRALGKTFPGKNIEVINLGMSAISSYTLVDIMDEVIEQSPDALLIYTGHNEYYGALGVGSVQTLGRWPALVHLYLKLQSFKVFLLLRDIMGWFKTSAAAVFHGNKEIDDTNTLMARIVGEQTIPYGSDLYKAGADQFRINMEIILEKAAEAKVPVILSELVSNLKGQAPFISVKDNKGNSAAAFFKQALKDEITGDYKNADLNYTRAKDFDALRFRAPEEFNRILANLSHKFSVPLVTTLSNFKNSSPGGIVGNNLMLEHLHPNTTGYFLIAKGFYEQMQKQGMIGKNWSDSFIDSEKNSGITSLDSVYASLVVAHLKSGWPFKPRNVKNTFFQAFHPANHIEEIAFKILTTTDYNLESGHMELGSEYEQKGMYPEALAEYNALISSIPHEPEFYQKAAVVLLEQKEYEKASSLLQGSLKYRGNDFAYKWIGQIALMSNNFGKAIEYLQRADLTDQQVVFNLSRAFFSSGNIIKGDEYFNRLKNLSPKKEYVTHLSGLRTVAVLKTKMNH